MIFTMKQTKKHLVTLLLAFFFLLPLSTMAQVATETLNELKKELIDDSFKFIILNDAGHNGYNDQKIVAEAMGVIAKELDVETILSPGDQLHFHGVEHVNDPFWITNFEIIYTHPQLMKANWYAVPGNHEYKGNVDAFVAYNQISPRWKMPSRYYELKFELDNDKTMRILMLDTTPMIDRYIERSTEISNQNYKKQLYWADSVLTSEKTDWNLILGHHPIYGNSNKNPSELQDMQERLNPILLKNGIDFYVSGHIHNFQHTKKEGNPIEYIINTSAGQSRSIYSNEGLTFGYEDTGFILGEATSKKVVLRLINKKGETVYLITKDK